MQVEYSSNNSGGKWWLTDDNWKALEAAGWKVEWYADKTDSTDRPYKNGRWLGALATYATLEGCSSLREAATKWESITGMSATDAGCPCCGQPHTFRLYDDKGSLVEVGLETSCSASW